MLQELEAMPFINTSSGAVQNIIFIKNACTS